MPYANNEGVRIRYEVEGEGPPLVLHHGFGCFLETWYDGYVEGLKGDYQLVLMDARGHGESDKPHDRESYRLALRVADVVAVLDDLGIRRAHFHGYSMGGYIGWGIAKYAPGRFLSLIIGGAGASEETWDETESGPGPLQELMRQGPDIWVAALEGMFGHWWRPEWKARFLAADLEALDAMASRKEGISHDEVLAKLTLPCLVFVGENDEPTFAQKTSEAVPNATFVCFPGLDHIDAANRTDLVLPLMRKFLAEVGEG
ncbi:MAG: alpha/beta hydrolase [Anaerolineae bacterium]|nr:alpha/beta hydrolase [Anaerolineae bacterium]